MFVFGAVRPGLNDALGEELVQFREGRSLCRPIFLLHPSIVGPEIISLKTEMALDSARVRSGSVSFSIRVESFSGIDSSR